MTVESFLKDWLVLRSGELKPRTLETYNDLFTRYVFPAVGGLAADDLDPQTVRHLLAAIMATGKSRTAEMLYTVLKCAFRDLDRNPLDRIRRPLHRQRSPDPWTDEEMRTYLEGCKHHRHGLALSLALLLGLRRGEICGLRWKDVDLVAGELHVVNQRVTLATGETIDCTPKSSSSVRTIPLPPQIVTYLKPFRGLPEAYVTPLTPSGLDQAHRSLVTRLDLRAIPLHGLRHSMATSCIRHGGEMRALQNVLGHASYATTANRYTHPDNEMRRSAVDAATNPCYTVIHRKPPFDPLTLNQGVQGSSP